MSERSTSCVPFLLAMLAATIGTNSLAAACGRTGLVEPLSERSASELPFRLYQECLIVVDGSFRGADKLRFLIDTGAMRSVVDKRVAKKLGLAAAEGAVQLAAVNEITRVDQVIVPELKFGAVQIGTLRAVAGDLVYLSGSGARIDAIIGLDVLRSSSFSIDYEARRMTFGPLAASSQAVPFQTISPLLTVTVHVEGQAMRLMVDTAARRLVLFDGRAQAKLPNLPWRFTAIQSPAARSYVRELEIGRMRLGDAEWRQRPAFLMNVPAFADGDLDGILAPSGLCVKRLDFDFDRNLLGWAGGSDCR
jgi:predicted aspartyl protease